jgi:hypothetical protein
MSCILFLLLTATHSEKKHTLETFARKAKRADYRTRTCALKEEMM